MKSSCQTSDVIYNVRYDFFYSPYDVIAWRKSRISNFDVILITATSTSEGVGMSNNTNGFFKCVLQPIIFHSGVERSIIGGGGRGGGMGICIYSCSQTFKNN